MNEGVRDLLFGVDGNQGLGAARPAAWQWDHGFNLNHVFKRKRTIEPIILKSSFYFAYLPLNRHFSPFKSHWFLNQAFVFYINSAHWMFIIPLNLCHRSTKGLSCRFKWSHDDHQVTALFKGEPVNGPRCYFPLCAQKQTACTLRPQRQIVLQFTVC